MNTTPAAITAEIETIAARLDALPPSHADDITDEQIAERIALLRRRAALRASLAA